MTINRYASLNSDEENICQDSRKSIKQLLKKLKYANEEYFCTLSPELKEKIENIKLNIIMLRGIKSKYVNKNFVTYEMRKKKEDKMNKEKIKKEKKKQEREKKRERNRIKKEKEKLRAKAERESRREQREKAEREEREKAEREEREKAEKEEREKAEKEEREKAEKEKVSPQELKKKVSSIFKIIIPQDICIFIEEPSKKYFKKLSIKYHPDKGGDTQLMKIVNYIWDKYK
uniref:J domain-containing protein n=1 Tax=viral metagenome TaxID=1070528 RepID=A0A6C0AL90_9ZZZZ